MNALPDPSVAPTKSQSWHWSLRPFTIIVVGCVLALAFALNFPAAEVPHANLEDGDFRLRTSPDWEYEHGWPARYVRRELFRPLDPPASGKKLQRRSPWQPWDGVLEFHAAGLLIDFGIWGVALALVAVAAGKWRTPRQALWQLGIRDLLVLTAAAGLLCAWFAGQRYEQLHEQALVDAIRQRGRDVHFERTIPGIPAILPDRFKQSYRSLAARVWFLESDGDGDLACQFGHLITLAERTPRPGLGSHLRRMPQLEALDLWRASLPYFDFTRQATLLSELPGMPNVRGVNLSGTNATDSDLAWLAKCPRLEVIDLSETSIGDEGIRNLRSLPRLRKLLLASPRLTDEGCRRLAEFPALEDLSIASRNIHDEGVRDLGRLQKLRILSLSATASEAALADLRRQLPKCDVSAHSYSH